jgi:hypothetical protein
MAKWLCQCGNQMRSSGAIPNPQEWHLVSDPAIGELFDRERAVEVEDVLDRAKFVYRCEQCDRLHVFWDTIGDWPPTIYVPEGTDI